MMYREKEEKKEKTDSLNGVHQNNLFNLKAEQEGLLLKVYDIIVETCNSETRYVSIKSLELTMHGIAISRSKEKNSNER